MKEFFKRGANLLKLGLAARQIKNSTNEDQRQWDKQYLFELPDKSRGIPTKIGQFLTMEDQSSGEPVTNSLDPMPYEEVTELLNNAYGEPFDNIFIELDKSAKAASLGQLHFGRLKDGTEVAVKVQYPETDKGLKAELDYVIEMKHQIRYRQLIPPLERILVPEVIEELCRPNVLVLKKEEGFGLEKAETMISVQKQAIGRLLLEHYFHMLFRHGFVHADPQPVNLAFRQFKKDYFVLILYDFGSLVEISSEMRLALLRIILALRNHERIDPVSCLLALGFDVKKLDDLRPTLPALLSVLFEPFLVEAPYHVKNWRMSERFDQTVGEMKWRFRSAAPLKLIFLMRTLHDLTTILSRLDVALPWQFLLDKHLSDIYPEAQALQLTEFKTSQVIHSFDEMARYLKIHIVKKNGNKISLTMPARCADDLEDVIDESVKESINRHKIDLQAIQKKIQKSGFISQPLFSLIDEECNIKVWLE
jgi:predicted unusual protein kinase regulating ubiquinone biosynthesis (AarF/ABC1/UbiB family)